MPPPRRLTTPAGNGEVLAVPGFDRVPELVERNRKLLDTADVKIDGLSLREIRVIARREVLDLAREYTQIPGTAVPGISVDTPFILAGHQPEFAHPGVWAKHFALNGVARKIGGIPLNIVVDNDTLKTTSLRIPVLGDHDPRLVHHESLPFDRLDGAEPYENRQVRDSECFRTFPERAVPLCLTWGIEPLLTRVWRDVVDDLTTTIGGKFAAARRTWEREWGCVNLELPVSRLSGTQAFWRFAAHLVADAGRFRDVYNRAVADYRLANGIRGRHHPVPDLEMTRSGVEIPFWQFRTTGGRSRAFVPPKGSSPLVDPLRPRALTLTLFARLCLGDFFIHGIGGGKYDEVTDAIIRDYFGIEPPAYQVLSATLHLPLPTFPYTPTDVAQLERLERDLYWNPHRHLPDSGKAMRELRELAAVEPPTSRERKQRYREFRRLGDELRPRVADQLDEVRQRLKRARQEAHANAILQRRDYSWILYPEDVLKPFMQQFLTI